MPRRRLRRCLRRFAGAVAVLVLLLLGTFALPVRTWRTGELPAPPLSVEPGGPPVVMSRRVWIDTDAACGHGRRADPDDCLALLLLARSLEISIVGISTVFGNARLDVTDDITRELVAKLRAEGHDLPEVYRGAAAPRGGDAREAVSALRRALERGPLTILALGPLTNVAAALDGRPDLQQRVSRIVAVMGRRPGHIFHPAEGHGGGLLFGHGPVFRDLNFDKDRRAAVSVLAMRLPMTFVPYEAARAITLTGGDLDRLAGSGGAAFWVAVRSRRWLDFWNDAVGREGFYPFDLLAAQYVLDPSLFDCARSAAWVGKDRRLTNIWFLDPEALLIGSPQAAPDDAMARAEAIYCPGLDEDLRGRLAKGLGRREGG